MRGLIGIDDAVSVCQWQVAESYFLYGEAILVDSEAGWKSTMDKPLTDPNLLLSFAKLGGRGQDLPQATILRWVRRHGVLRLKDPTQDRLALDNQAPITLSEFRQEAGRAHEALTLFKAIHTEDWATLRYRISRRRLDPLGQDRRRHLSRRIR